MPFRKSDLAAGASLVLAVALLYGRTVTFMPRSDHWHAFYLFNHVSPGLQGWLEIANYALFGHARFQPLSHIYLYLSYLLFNPWFECHNALHLATFSAILIGFYGLCKSLSGSALLSGLLGLMLASGYVHCDLAVWSYHFYILAGTLCILLSALCLRGCFLGKSYGLLLIADLLLLAAMLSYEPFVLAPLAVFCPFACVERDPRKTKAALGHIAAVYLIFAGLFIWSRAWPSYSGTSYQIGRFLTLAQFLRSTRILITNLFYVNLLGLFFPGLAFPPDYPGGITLVMRLAPRVLLLVGRHWALAWAIFGGGMFLSLKRLEGARFWSLISLALFLIAYLGIIAFGRTMTNNELYLYVQFRYEFFADLLLLAVLALILGKPFREGSNGVRFLAALPILASIAWNARCTHQVMERLDWTAADHRRLIGALRKGLRDGTITESRKVYVDPRLPERSVFWNRETGNFPGTIQWFFHDSERYFAADQEDAKLTLNPDGTLSPK